MPLFQLTAAIIKLLILFLVILFSSLPLYLAVKFLGGKASILNVFLVNLGAAILIPFVKQSIGTWGGIISFIFLLFIYKNMFSIGWVRSFLVWILQFVIIALIIIILAAVGISLII